MTWLTVRFSRVSFRVDRRAPLILAGLVLALLAVAALNLSTGSFPIPVKDVVDTLLRPGATEFDFVVNELRMPRTILAIMVGMGLATSGAILQGLTGNDLAAPEIIGIDAGASVTVIAAIILFPEISVSLYPVAALVGAFTTAAVIYVMAWRGGLSPLRLILIGIAVGAVANAITSTLITLGEIKSVMGAFAWLAGSVNQASWKHVVAILPWLVILLPVTWFCARQLNLFTMGDDAATGLGMRIELVRLVVVTASVGLAAASISVAGTVGFVGLIAPHVARRLIGPSHEGLLPASALIGGLIILAADTAGRNVFAPLQIPVGIVTAIVGVPFFLFLLYRHRDQW